MKFLKNNLDYNKALIITHLKLYYKVYKKTPISTELNDFPFSKYHIKKYCKSWTDALIEANIPLNRNEPVFILCNMCHKVFERQVKEIKKTKRSFCSSACNAKYYTTGRKHTQETKNKISQTLKAHKIFKD